MMKNRKCLFLAISLITSACTGQPVTGTSTSTSVPEGMANAPSLAADTEIYSPSGTAQTDTPEPDSMLTGETPQFEKSPAGSDLGSSTLMFDPTAALVSGGDPLSKEGPWLVIGNGSVLNQAYSTYDVMNVDGTNELSIPLTPLSENRAWISFPAGSGSYMAFRTVSVKGAPFEIQADGIDDSLWIVKFPENRVVKRIQLLSGTAWQAIEEARAADPEAFEQGGVLPTQLGLVLSPESFQWSPDGRYLAYTGASSNKPGTYLYVYDTEEYTVQRLTEDRAGAQIWAWSPDGQTILYRNGQTSTVQDSMPELADIDRVYALTLDQKETLLYMPDGEEKIIHISNSDFWVANSGFENPLWNLRRVDIQTGEETALYADTFTSAACDPIGENFLLLFDPSRPFNEQVEEAQGIYRIDPSTGKLDFLIEGAFSIKYHDSLGWFSTLQDNSGGTRDVVLFNLSGEETLRLTGMEAVTVSPDGKWMIGSVGQSWRLYDLKGNVLEEGDGSETKWLGDSTGFLSTCQDGAAICLYLQANDWQAEAVFSGANTMYKLIPETINE